MKKSSILSLAVALLLTACPAEAKPNKRQPAPLKTLEIINKVNNHWQETQKAEVRSFWDNAAYHTGNIEAYKMTGNARWLEYTDKWCRHNAWQGARDTNPANWKYKTYGEGQDFVLFGDWQICFQTYLDMYEMNPDPYKVARAKEVIDYECSLVQNDFWWWADALYMVMPVFTKMYKTFGDEKYLDKLYDNFSYAYCLMYDNEEHLYYRDGKYIYPKHKSINGKKDFWARGDGWVLAGLAKVLTDMPTTYRNYNFFLQRYKELAAAVAKCQQPEGYWTRSMLDPDHAVGPETSGTAFFTYGLLWGVNNGILDRNEYLETIDRAWNYLTTKALQEDGSVGYVQPIGEKAIPGQEVSAQSTANFGVGAFLLAACERLRFEDQSVRPANNRAFTVTVSNETDMQRQEVVEIPFGNVKNKLGIQGGRQFVITNALGQEVPYQLTYDNKVLVEASVRPHGTAKFTVRKGTPQVFKTVVYGRMYPERVDDIAWENDRSAYRCYGPALQRSGEDAYGIDVWTKNTPDLEVERRYWVEDHGKAEINRLKKEGKKDEAFAAEIRTTYHFDHGYGLDCYKVGPTLGCGTPALMDGDKIVFPYCYKDYELLDNGPLRFTVKLVYNPASYKGDTNVVETRILSLDKGSNFNKMQVTYEGLSSKADVAAGVVIHQEDLKSVVLGTSEGSQYVAYADPTDNPAGQNFQIFVAAVFPEKMSEVKKVMYEKATRGNAGHALGIKRDYKNGQTFNYWFGSAWSKFDCRTMDEWQARIHTFQQSLQKPLKVKM